MRRVFTDTLIGRARPSKRFCPPLTHSPHSDLSHPPSGFRCAENDRLRSISGWQSRDVSGFLPLLTCSSITCSPRDMRHVWYSPTADGPHTGHSSAHEQGRQRLSFVVDDVAPLGPFRHPNAGMSFRLQHSAPSIAFLSWTGASTRGIILGSPHSSVRLHTSVLPQSPPHFASKASVLKQELSSLLLKGAIWRLLQYV